jgi:hypothetical protein
MIASAAVTVDPEAVGDGTPDERRSAHGGRRSLVVFATLVVCSYIGTASRQVGQHQSGLLLLSSRVQHLVAVAGGDISFWSYFWIGFFRLALAFVVCHLIGRAYGRTVLIWFGKYLGVRRANPKIMDMFRHEWFAIQFFIGSNIVAAISGIIRQRAVWCCCCRSASCAPRVLVARRPHRRRRVDAVLDFLNKHRFSALMRRSCSPCLRGKSSVARSELRTRRVQECSAWQL